MNSCILSKFYIKPQHSRWNVARCWVVSYRNSTSNHNGDACLLHRGGVVSYRNSTSNHNHGPGQPLPKPGCILSKFYIKPQHRVWGQVRLFCCILSKFYIKPQQFCVAKSDASRCILSKFYIKPQQIIKELVHQAVVSYRNSTSNHNVGPHIDW